MGPAAEGRATWYDAESRIALGRSLLCAGRSASPYSTGTAEFAGMSTLPIELTAISPDGATPVRRSSTRCTLAVVFCNIPEILSTLPSAGVPVQEMMMGVGLA